MNSNNQTCAITTACQLLGSKSALAMSMGISVPTVSQWVSGKRPVPPARCVSIEASTGGKVTRQDLRPDDYWLIWPELKKQEEVA